MTSAISSFDSWLPGDQRIGNAASTRPVGGKPMERTPPARWPGFSCVSWTNFDYGREGVHWRLLDDDNPLGLHRLIRVRDLRGLKSDLWTSIGYSRMRASRLDEARDFFTRAHEHDPESTFTLLALAQVAAADGKWGEVDALLARSLQLDPERAVAHALRASLAAGAGRRREAIVVVQFRDPPGPGITRCALCTRAFAP
jgi:tetratricopeptide (TPR) repeat protein